MDPNELESLTNRALRRLPVPRAPQTLLVRVMRAVEAEALPWYARPWLRWPLAWQVASAVMVVGVLVGASLAVGMALTMFNPDAVPGVATLVSSIEQWLAPVASAARGATAIWRAVIEPLAYIALLPVLMMFAATVVFGAALGRLAFGGPSQS
jgi:hypothetical protein